jgi:hypothetical protein
MLNETTAGRKDELYRMLTSGEITPAQYQQHMANPDLESLTSLAAAAAEDIARVIELLEDENYEAPTEFQDLEAGVREVHMAYLRLKDWEDVPQNIFDSFEQWMLHAKAIVDGQKAGMVATAASQALPPGMAPMSLANPAPAGAPPLPMPPGPMAPMGMA